MWRIRLFTSLGRIVLVGLVLIVAPVIVLICLHSCAKEEPMPVVVNPCETVHMSELQDQHIGEEKITKEHFYVPKDAIAHPAEESNESMALRESQERIVTEEQQIEDIFTIQVAAFRDLSRAKLLVEKLNGEGYPAYICPRDLKKQDRWYRVFVGKFKSKKQADLLLPELKNMFEDSFVRFR